MDSSLYGKDTQAILNLEYESLFKSLCLFYSEKCPSEHDAMCPSKHEAMCPSEHELEVIWNWNINAVPN